MGQGGRIGHPKKTLRIASNAVMRRISRSQRAWLQTDMTMPHDLDAIPNWMIAQLVRAGVDRKSAFKWPILVTGSDQVGVSGRVVVLRRFDPETHIATIYTDKRSTKVQQLRANKHAELVFFDPKRMLQVRIRGLASVHLDGPKRETAFLTLSDRNASDYSTLLAPGVELPQFQPERDLRHAKDNFAIIDVEADVLDVLSLERAGHRRAKIIRANGALQARWVTP